jgi:hypothetical protein
MVMAALVSEAEGCNDQRLALQLAMRQRPGAALM